MTSLQGLCQMHHLRCHQLAGALSYWGQSEHLMPEKAHYMLNHADLWAHSHHLTPMQATVPQARCVRICLNISVPITTGSAVRY